MTKRILPFIMSVLISTAASAAGSEWIQIANTEPGSAFLDRSTISPAGDDMAVRVMRNHDDTITMGTDPETARPMYPHRSVQITYLVNCKAKTLAFYKWKMYSGNFGEGEVVWADEHPGALVYARPEGSEEKFAIGSACAVRAALAIG
jgi:hypothetical protein